MQLSVCFCVVSTFNFGGYCKNVQTNFPLCQHCLELAHGRPMIQINAHSVWQTNSRRRMIKLLRVRQNSIEDTVNILTENVTISFWNGDNIWTIFFSNHKIFTSCMPVQIFCKQHQRFALHFDRLLNDSFTAKHRS